MSLGLGELTTQAHQLVAAGDVAGARDLLHPALAAVDPASAYDSTELAEAAGLHARVLLALGEPLAARGWAAFAYSATTRLHGSADERTIAAGAVLAAVLHRVGSHARAAHLYRLVITELTAIDGPESQRVLAAHADLATVEHVRGECDAARDRLRNAWEMHREVYGDGHAAGLKMLARLGAMERDCGQLAEADEHLALAEQLCRDHLPAGHPLTDQVAALAQGTADPAHPCAEPPAQKAVVPVQPTAQSRSDPPPRSSTDGWSGVRRVRLIPNDPDEDEPLAYPTPGRLAQRSNVVTALIAVLGAIAVAAAISLVVAVGTPPDSRSRAARGASSQSTPGASTPAGDPPTGLALGDTREAVALTWGYPPGAEGPVVVSGGRNGQEIRAFQELPPGTTSYVVHGLNPNLDYCFSVAVVYGTDRISRTPLVCTARNTGTRAASPRPHA